MVDFNNQTNFQDQQNFEININDIYASFIQEIDAVRSFVNITNPENLQRLNNLKVEDINKLAQLLKPELTVQESRPHAFYRLIGFPVISNDFKFYNPGMDIIKDNSRTITKDFKIQVANNPIIGFRDLSIKRELYIQNILKIFSLPKTIDAGTLSLLSGINIRKFVSPFDKNDQSFDMVSKSQTYKVDLGNFVGNRKIDLPNYQDVNGDQPSQLLDIIKNQAHYIKPFIVDPRIDFSVSPSKRLIAIPFVPDKSKLKVGDNTYIKRPLLEKVIIDRFTVVNPDDALGTADKALLDFIKSIPAIQDQNIINKINKDVFGLLEITQFVNFLNIIRAMMIELVNAQLIIQSAQSKYYWVPQPSTIGPENGSSVRGIFINKNINSELITKSDQELIDAFVKVTINKLSLQASNATGQADLGGFAFDNFKTAFTPETSPGLGDLSQQNFDSLNTKRTKELQKANDALRTIEIILGEFSGLGLCDIIAVLGALYIMPRDSLLGFLDDDAIMRMGKNLNGSFSNSSGIEASMDDFTSTVKDFYNLMDQIYQDARKNNKK